MTFPDFTGGTKAFVDIGDGGAHSPQLRIQADDDSCRWNGFTVYTYLCGFVPITPVDPTTTSQISQYTAPAGGGSFQAPAANWPHMLVYDARMAALSGYDLEFRIRANFSGSTSAGSLCVSVIGSACCADSHPGPIFGDYTESAFSALGTCVSCLSPDDPIEVGIRTTNFSPITGAGVTVGAGGANKYGRLEAQWAATGDSPPDWMPDQALTIDWTPPCPTPGGSLVIGLAADHCGIATTTYTALRNAINALGLGLTASVLGGHGADIATPDPSCASNPITSPCDPMATISGCVMSGAECSGAVDN